MSNLSQIVKLISDSFSSLQKSAADAGLPLPNLDDKWTPESEAFRRSPERAELANVIAAAAFQLAATLTPVEITLYEIAGGHFDAATLRVALEAHVIECLQDHPEGLDVKEIAKRCGNLDPGKLSRILRYLSTKFFFREVAPNVFANNRLSSMLDTGKTLEVLQKDPDNKHVDTRGYGAFVGHACIEDPVGSFALWDHLKDPATGPSAEPELAPIVKGLGINIPYFQWYSQPEQAVQRRNFGIAMQGMANNQPSEAMIEAFDWQALPKDAVLVDVGGGIGTSSLPVAARFPIKLVIQDFPEVVEHGLEVARKKFSQEIDSGRIVFQGHNFFTPQPVKGADVYMIKQCLHNCSDKYALKVLQHLRDAASPNSKLIVVETITRYACHDEARDLSFEGAADVVTPPAPVLANYGPAKGDRYIIDISMLTLFNAQDRTLRHWNDLLTQTGWKIIKVHRGLPYYEPIIAVPI